MHQLDVIVWIGIWWGTLASLAIGCKPLKQKAAQSPIVVEVDQNNDQAMQRYRCDKPSVKPHFTLTIIEPFFEEKPFRIEIPESNRNAFLELEQRIEHGFQPKTFGNIRAKLVAAKPSPEHPWTFKFDPETIKIDDYSVDVCDGSLEFVEENRVQWLGKEFCAFQAANFIAKIEKSWNMPENCLM